ncbi:MAG: hypothetical protein LBU88_00240 [Treponema sp.]|jgi:hypothetical protein|nr:hypothetical protein [Treponema sp.]
MINCEPEKYHECKKIIAKELEDGFIESSIQYSHRIGDGLVKIGSREYNGKTYQVFITVEEKKDE